VSNQNRNNCPTFSGIGVQFKSESVSSVVRILQQKGISPEILKGQEALAFLAL
jgi:hypothetical protein